MQDANWRAIARAEGLERRPANDREHRPDRGFVEQPEERIAPSVRRIAPVMLPDNQYRRRVLVQRANAAPVTPPALVRPFAERLLGPAAPVTQVVATLEELEEMRDMELDAAEREQRLEAEEEEDPEEPQMLVKVERAVEPEKKKRGYRFHSRETIESALARVAAGETVQEIGRSIGVDAGLIGYWVRRERQGMGVAAVRKADKSKSDEGKRRVYHPVELKLAAVERVKHLRTTLPEGVHHGIIAMVATELGVPREALQRWVNGEGLTRGGKSLPAPVNGTTTLPSRPAPPPTPSQVVSEPIAPPAPTPATLDSKLDELIERQLDQLMERKLQEALKRRFGG